MSKWHASWCFELHGGFDRRRQTMLTGSPPTKKISSSSRVPVFWANSRFFSAGSCATQHTFHLAHARAQRKTHKPQFQTFSDSISIRAKRRQNAMRKRRELTDEKRSGARIGSAKTELRTLRWNGQVWPVCIRGMVTSASYIQNTCPHSCG